MSINFIRPIGSREKWSRALAVLSTTSAILMLRFSMCQPKRHVGSIRSIECCLSTAIVDSNTPESVRIHWPTIKWACSWASWDRTTRFCRSWTTQKSSLLSKVPACHIPLVSDESVITLVSRDRASPSIRPAAAPWSRFIRQCVASKKGPATWRWREESTRFLLLSIRC